MSSEYKPPQVSVIWVLAISSNALSDKVLFYRAIEALSNTKGCSPISKTQERNMLSVIFEKSQELDMPIDPKSEEWGFTQEEGVKLIIKSLEQFE